MPVFPQVMFYPVTRHLSVRTVLNQLADGNTVIFPDSDASLRGWELQAKGLTTAEWNAIESFYNSVSGQWQTFTFLDPIGNLLANSEDFTASSWTNGPLIQLSGNVADPFGATRATHAVNTGQAAQTIAQTLSVPGNFQYALSLWVRGSSLTLTAASATRAFSGNSNWRRISFSVSLGQNSNTVTFGAQLSPGASVDLFGMQVDAQAAPSDYKRTGAAGGVYSNARFSTDAFTLQAQGTDVYDATIRIVSSGS